MKRLLWFTEGLAWSFRCRYNLWLHGPYGLAKVVEKIPFRYLVRFLRRYGASVGENCRFERGINIHRPLGKRPFENLVIGNNVYLGHNTLFDLTGRVTVGDDVIIASGCQVWTHAGYYQAGKAGREYLENRGPVTICNGAFIYSGVVVSHGVVIGASSRIGANSVVTRDIPESVFAGGVPARELKKI